MSSVGIGVWATTAAILRDLFEALFRGGEPARFAGELLEAARDAVAPRAVDLDRPGAPAGVRSAAISVLPAPAKGSSTMSPRREQSAIASATSATGVAVVSPAACSPQAGRPVP